MSRAAPVSLVFAALVLSLCGRQLSTSVLAVADENTGLIEGIVRYEDGNPVGGATVYAQPMGQPMAGVVPHAETDETGHFAIPHLWLGKYAVGAEKQDEDYPNMTMQFCSDGKFETVVLTSRHSLASVSIRLGPKAGVLVGTVADAVTGAPLNPCVEFRRASEPNNFLRGSGLVKPRYRLLVPPDTGVLIKMWLDGYRPWYSPGTLDKSRSTPVRLKPGEVQTFDIRLQPAKSADKDV